MSAWPINLPSSGTLAFSLRLAPYCRSCPCDRPRDTFMTNRRSSWSKSKEREGQAIGAKPSHLNVVLSKAALSGPFVCLRARDPCPLSVSSPGADRARAHSSRVPCWSRSSDRAQRALLCAPTPGSCGRAARLQACVPVAPLDFVECVVRSNVGTLGQDTIIVHAGRCDLQLPVRRGTVKSVNHAMNLQDLFRQLFNHPRTLEDLGITEELSKQIMSATIDDWRESLQNPCALACVLSAQIIYKRH